MSAYVFFEDIGTSKSGKTRIYEVRDRHAGLLGQIRWFGRWRQYTFMPEPGSVYSQDCLLDIAVFVREQAGEDLAGADGNEVVLGYPGRL